MGTHYYIVSEAEQALYEWGKGGSFGLEDLLMEGEKTELQLYLGVLRLVMLGDETCTPEDERVAKRITRALFRLIGTTANAWGALAVVTEYDPSRQKMLV